MRREPPFALDPMSRDAVIRRLNARRERIDEHNEARTFGLAERHARKLRRLAERARPSEDPPVEEAA